MSDKNRCFNWPMAIVVTMMFLLNIQSSCARRAERKQLNAMLERMGEVRP